MAHKYRVSLEAQFDTDAGSPEEIRDKLRHLLRDNTWYNVNLETGIQLLDGPNGAGAVKYQILTCEKSPTSTVSDEKHIEHQEYSAKPETRTKTETPKEKSHQTHREAQNRRSAKGKAKQLKSRKVTPAIKPGGRRGKSKR